MAYGPGGRELTPKEEETLLDAVNELRNVLLECESGDVEEFERIDVLKAFFEKRVNFNKHWNLK